MLLSLRWAVETPGVVFSFLLKTDDDAFVCTSAVLGWLHRWQAQQGRSLREREGQARRRWLRRTVSSASDAETAPWVGLYAGAELMQRCIGLELVPLFDSPLGEPFRDARCVRGWRFPRPTMAGAGYLLSRSLVTRAVRVAAHMAPVPSAEDATIGLLLHWRGEPVGSDVDSGSAMREGERAVGWGSRQGDGAAVPSVSGFQKRAARDRTAARPLPFEQARLHVVPFANRRNAGAIVEKLAPLQDQIRLVRRRCRNLNNLVLHKLSQDMLRECAASKALANQSCVAHQPRRRAS